MARAPALQAGGQEFDSPQLHQLSLYRLRNFKVWDYKRLVQGKRGEIYEIILNVYRKKFDEVWRSNRKLRITKKHIEKYIDEKVN